MPGVLTTRQNSIYDDAPEERYHFPRTYLNTMERLIGQPIVYYEPRRDNGRQSYFATATIAAISPDANKADHFYAKIENYLDFTTLVPFKEGEIYFESALQRDDGETNRGAFGRSVREIPQSEFEVITRLGMNTPHEWDLLEPTDAEPVAADGLAETAAEFERPIIEVTRNEKFRARHFKINVKRAYDRTCALTGLRILNGGGRPEVQAAHIRPVAENGPDAIRNGIALSGTVHWMFDRGLVSLTDNFDILTMDKAIPEPLLGLLNKDGKAHVPDDIHAQPHSVFLRYHRENIFKG